MKRKLLIIDDYKPLLEELVDFFTYEGYKVSFAYNGAEGVQKALTEQPYLIVCDIQMPLMDGYQVYKTLEQIPQTAHVPFIFLTAKAQPEDFRVGLRLGADDYIVKPVDLPELAETIKKRIDKYERAASIEHEKLTALMQNPQIGIYITDATGLKFVNKKFASIVGYPETTFKNKKLTDFVIANKEDLDAELDFCTNGTHSFFTSSVSIINADKKAVFLEIYGKHVKYSNVGFVIGSITEQVNSLASVSNIDLQYVIQNLIDNDKVDIASEIQNTAGLIEFEGSAKQRKMLAKLNLSKRELEVLGLICLGNTNIEIAEKLFISSRTVENHRASLLEKTETANTAALVAFSVKNKIV